MNANNSEYKYYTVTLKRDHEYVAKFPAGATHKQIEFALMQKHTDATIP